MINNSERVQLVKRSQNADHALTANEAGDDDVVFEQAPRRSLAKKNILWIIFIVSMLIVIGVISYFVYAHYENNDTNSAAAMSDTDALNAQTNSGSLSLPHSLSVEPMELTQKTVTPKLPGIYHINKAYNLFQGKNIYEISGADVIDFTWDDIYTMDDETSFEIPVEFRSVPNVEPSCDVHSKVNSVHFVSSTSVLEEQSESSSTGFQATIDLQVEAGAEAGVEADGFNAKGQVKATASTQLKFGVMFGHTSTSKSAKSQQKSGNEFSFSVETRNTYYKAEIDWSNKNTLKWKQPFLDAINELNDNPTNQSILFFTHKWGSHVLNKMQTGAYCKETAYVKSENSKTQVDDFHNDVSTNTEDFGYLHHDSTKESTKITSGNQSNGVSYEFADTYCKGEVKVTSAHCSIADATSNKNNPVVTSYEPLPIWKIADIATILNNQTMANIISIFKLDGYLNNALLDCSKNTCFNEHGICILKEEIWSHHFINAWDGHDFSKLVDDVCFCIDSDSGARFEGDFCGTRKCDCWGGVDCCCETEDAVCNQNGNTNLCSPIDFRCKAKIPKKEGGKIGEWCSCKEGVVIGACGSGGAADCAAKFTFDASTGIICGYPELGTYSSNSIERKCSYLEEGTGHSLPISCTDSDIPENHGLLVGLCGSTSDRDCQDTLFPSCQGISRIGISCARIEGIFVNPDDCFWIASSDYGTIENCPDSTFVATGYCGSGSGNDCYCKYPPTDANIDHSSLRCWDANVVNVPVNAMVKCCRLFHGPNPWL